MTADRADWQSSQGWSICGVLALTALAYLYSAFTGFLGDDFPLVETASRTTPISAFLARVDVYYRPLVWSTFALDYSLWGTSSAGYHTTNILIHVVNTLLVILIAREVLNKTWVHLVVGLYFGLTPTHAGTVIWLFGRTDLFCAAFYFATVLLLVKFAKRESAQAAFGLFITTMLALLCKEMAFSLPLVGLVIGFCYADGSFLKRALFAARGVLPVVLALVVYLAIRYVYVSGLPTSPMHDHWTVTKLAINLARYLATLTIPLDLEVVKPFFRAHLWVLVVCSLVFVLIAMGGALVLRRHPASVPVIVCTLLAISPVIRLFAPWYLYIPSLGIAILVGLMIELAPTEMLRRPVIRGMIGVLTIVHLIGLGQVQAAVRTSSDWVSECIDVLAREVEEGEIAVVTAAPTEYTGIPAFGWIYNLQYGLRVLGHQVKAIPLTGVRLSGETIDVDARLNADGELDIQVSSDHGFFRLPSLAAQQGALQARVDDRLETNDAILVMKALNDGGFPVALRIIPKSFTFSDRHVRLFTPSGASLVEVPLDKVDQP